MVEIYVARHGQDVDNSRGILNGRRDEPLTDLGRRQARDVAERMARAGFSLAPSSAAEAEGAPPPSSSSSSSVRLDAIYSSPLRRARETAEIFAEVLSSASGSSGSGDGPAPARADVLVLDDLQERDFGIMTGQPTSSILEKCGEDRVLKTETINYFLDPPGAETFPDLIVRAERLLARVRTTVASRSPPPEAILLVTHGDFGKMMYASHYGLGWEDVLRGFHFGNSDVLLLAREGVPERAHVFEARQFNA